MAKSPPPAWPGFRPLAVTAVEVESESVISVHLADPGGAVVPTALPGQFLTLRLNAVPGAKPLLRSYSLSGPPGAASYRISVKREAHGAGSQFLHARARRGDLLEAAARCWPDWPAGTGTSATAARARRTSRGATTSRPAGCRRPCWPRWSFRATPTPTSAARRRSWPRFLPP